MATAAIREAKIDAGRVVQRGFDALGRHYRPYFALGLLLIGLPTFASEWLTLTEFGASGAIFDLTRLSPPYLVNLVVGILTATLLQAVIVRSALAHFGGAGPEISKSFRGGFRFIIPMVLMSIITLVLSAIGAALLIVPGVIVFIMFLVSVPALIEERRGIFASLKRSRELTKGSGWRIFLLLLLYLVVYSVMLAIMAALVAALAENSIVLKALFPALTATILSVLTAVMLASLYLELREVKEGPRLEGLNEIFA